MNLYQKISNDEPLTSYKQITSNFNKNDISLYEEFFEKFYLNLKNLYLYCYESKNYEMFIDLASPYYTQSLIDMESFKKVNYHGVYGALFEVYLLEFDTMYECMIDDMILKFKELTDRIKSESDLMKQIKSDFSKVRNNPEEYNKWKKFALSQCKDESLTLDESIEIYYTYYKLNQIKNDTNTKI